MSPTATLGAYAAGLALLFAAATGVGRAVGPVGTAAEDPHGATQHAGPHGTPRDAQESDHPVAAPDVTGLAVSQEGYTLRLETPVLAAGRSVLAFSVTAADGRPVRDYGRTHDRELHLVVVRRDLTGFQHLHPSRDPGGRWSVPLILREAGSYKVFADFAPAGRERPLVLAADLLVPGTVQAAPPELPGTTTTVDGYTVTLHGRLVAGTESRLALSVSKGGVPVRDLEPYLAAYGHLVALRAGDLAYLHVHPEGAPGDGRTPAGPDITFSAAVPTAGEYRLYLDFAHAGVVRTAVLPVQAGSEPQEQGSEHDGQQDEHGEEHR